MGKLIRLEVFTSDSEQLNLDLFPGEPWNGRSPRALTRVGSGLFLRPEPPKATRCMVDPGQLEMWPSQGPHRKRSVGRVVSAGAPSLLPLKGPRRGRSRKNLFWER